MAGTARVARRTQSAVHVAVRCNRVRERHGPRDIRVREAHRRRSQAHPSPERQRTTAGAAQPRPLALLGADGPRCTARPTPALNASHPRPATINRPVTTTIVAVTPTLSDAVQSAGATLHRHAAEGHPVVVVSVFTRDGGAEDAAAAEALGLSGVVHLALDPAPSAATPTTASTMACGPTTSAQGRRLGPGARARAARARPDPRAAGPHRPRRPSGRRTGAGRAGATAPALARPPLRAAPHGRRAAGRRRGRRRPGRRAPSRGQARRGRGLRRGDRPPRRARRREGERLGAGGPVEILVQRPATDAR